MGGKTVAVCFETDEDLRILEMIEALSRHDHPRNAFKGQSPEAIIRAVLRDGVPYPYWHGVGSTEKPVGER